MSQSRSQCDACKHFVSPFDRDDDLDAPTCAAFPDGIPDRVYANEVDHRDPIPGDHGVQFVAAEGDSFPDWAF
jgi:hypothetical protein